MLSRVWYLQLDTVRPGAESAGISGEYHLIHTREELSFAVQAVQAARAQSSHLLLLLEVGYVCTWPESCTLSSKLTFFTAATATHPFRLGSQSIADITYRRATKDAPSDHNVSDKQRSSADDTVWFGLDGTESG